MTDSDLTKSTIAAILRRKVGETSATRLFENFPESVRRNMLTEVKLDAQEQPILASMRDEHRWVFLTTAGLYHFDRGKITHITFNEIDSAEMELTRDQQQPVATKAAATDIRITLTSGKEHWLTVEPFKGMVGIANVLQYVMRRNKRRIS